MRNNSITKVIASFGVMLSLNATAQKATVREDVISLNTYPFSDPNPVPQPESSIYPYFSFDKFSDKGTQQDWKCVTLENPYLKVTVMPSQGGKIWAAIEKSSGESFVYYNHAAKYRLVAMRGPWTSGGIEANFGVIGHVPTTATPVDYFIRENVDGSVSCYVASLELITHTWWQVEINLPPDKAYLTTKTTFYNATPLVRPYYHWMNAAYKATDDLEMYFPGQYHIGHPGDAHPWPVNEQGRDISKYANNDFGEYKSYHVLGEYSDFYAAYYRNSQLGSVHHSAYGDKPGMKIWIWGLSRQGMIWENLLSDTDGQYVELQSGRIYNQANGDFTPFKQFSFEPYATDRWTEYWYPIKEIGGAVKANTLGALNLVRNGTSCTLAFCPVQKIDDYLTVTADGKEIFSKKLTLNVLETWKETLPDLPAGAKLKVVISKSPSAEPLLVYSEAPEDRNLSRPVTSPEDFDKDSYFGLFIQGQQALYANDLKRADTLLREALKKEPYAIPALRHLATVCLRRAQYAKADSLARIILSINAYDPDGNILYGLANSFLGRSVDAMDGFSIAGLTASHRTAASILLAKEYARKQDWKQVLHYASQALNGDASNQDALSLKMLAYRKMSQPNEAEKIYGIIESEYPLNHTSRFERYLQNGKIDEFMGLIRCELPNETLAELASWYESAGCLDEAYQLLTLPPSDSNAIGLIRAAYILHIQGKASEAKAMLAKAEALSTHQALPSRTETLPALKWAVSQSDSWKMKYYLAILTTFLGDKAKGSDLLEECGNIPDDYAFYLTRANYRTDEAKLQDLLASEKINPSWRVGMQLIRYYEQTKQYDKMYDYAVKYRKLYPNYDAIGLKYASALLYLKKYAQSADYLSKMTVLPGEGGVEGRVVYRKAWLYQALQSAKNGNYSKALTQLDKARLWPENLGAGKPYEEDIDSRAEDFLTAYCYEKLKNPQQAAAFREKLKQKEERFAKQKDVMFDTIKDEL
ncbi:MAG: DUF5107 domain-containing protein [Tannerella sp.]|nr:DUF5107 domain-containing protein [Tannerella sp.]